MCCHSFHWAAERFELSNPPYTHAGGFPCASFTSRFLMQPNLSALYHRGTLPQKAATEIRARLQGGPADDTEAVIFTSARMSTASHISEELARVNQNVSIRKTLNSVVETMRIGNHNQAHSMILIQTSSVAAGNERSSSWVSCCKSAFAIP